MFHEIDSLLTIQELSGELSGKLSVFVLNKVFVEWGGKKHKESR